MEFGKYGMSTNYFNILQLGSWLVAGILIEGIKQRNETKMNHCIGIGLLPMAGWLSHQTRVEVIYKTQWARADIEEKAQKSLVYRNRLGAQDALMFFF
jgi:hypothetical protein